MSTFVSPLNRGDGSSKNMTEVHEGINSNRRIAQRKRQPLFCPSETLGKEGIDRDLVHSDRTKRYVKTTLSDNILQLDNGEQKEDLNFAC